jgi:hypothetical protein
MRSRNVPSRVYRRIMVLQLLLTIGFLLVLAVVLLEAVL